MIGWHRRTKSAFSTLSYLTHRLMAEYGTVDARAFSGPKMHVRTAERAPSAPTSNEPTAREPSANTAVTLTPSSPYTTSLMTLPYYVRRCSTHASEHLLGKPSRWKLVRTSTGIPSAHRFLNFLLDTRNMRSSGTSFSSSPVFPFQVGRTPGSGGTKDGSLAAVLRRSKRLSGRQWRSRGSPH